MPKNLGLYNDDLSTPRKQDVDACYGPNNAPPYPVTSVNGQTGGVNLTASDVGAVSTDNITQTLGTSTTKVPSEKAVSDAIVAAGGGGGGGGESDVFYAIYGTTTNAEILAAYEVGKAVYLKVDGSYGVYRLLLVNSTTAYFGGITSTRKFARYRCFSDTWTTYGQVVLAPMATSAAVTLTASGWSSSKTQTVTVTGVLADETKQLITPAPAAASQAAYYNAGIRCTGQEADNLTFTAKTIPTADLTVYVTIQEVGA